MRKTKMGQELIAGMEEALADVRGANKLRRTTREIAEPARAWRKEQIVELRKTLFGVSQPVFAALLSVTVSTVRAWEQGQKSPSGAARRLLEIASMAPDILMRPWAEHSQVAERMIAMKALTRRPKQAKKRKPSLVQRLKGVTKENRHHEQDWGTPAGREAW